VPGQTSTRTQSRVFRNAGESGTFFGKSCGYAVFPTIGKGGIGIGGAYGKGRVYAQGKHVGNTSMTQVTVGFQPGGQACSQIIFFEDERAYKEFTSGYFEFGAQASAVAISAGTSAETASAGTSASVSGGRHAAQTTTAGTGYQKGMAVFSVAGGLTGVRGQYRRAKIPVSSQTMQRLSRRPV
jgi:lipid-binding SYLF domain-containing protein